jgi:hypothetical protein
LNKNGAVVRRAVGYRRFEGLEAAVALAGLYRSLRLFVNYFQPSFKLTGKVRDDARVKKHYHAPATPYQRLLADPRTPDPVRRKVDVVYATLDPVRLVSDIRQAQARLVEIADQPIADMTAEPRAPTLAQFLASLRTAWQSGEIRPTSRTKETKKRGRRRPDPLAMVTADLRAWFDAEPWRTSRELFERLQTAHPGKSRMAKYGRYNGESKTGAARSRTTWCSVQPQIIPGRRRPRIRCRRETAVLRAEQKLPPTR